MAKTKSDIIYPFSNPDKILYPDQGITKLDLAKYYNEIQDWILPHLIKRPLTLVRCPQGAGQKCFYQKHLNDNESHEGLFGIDIEEKSGTDIYIYLKDVKGLMALVQMGVLEIHPWGCHIKNIEKPDLITFDLDPGPKVAWTRVIEAAFLIKELLEKIKLKSFVKTTGGKGLHVVVPIKPKFDWDDVKNFTHTFVDYIVGLHPKEYIGKMTKAERTNKIFIDYLRNQRGATAVSAYSTRARAGATVATPLGWDELSSKIGPDFFNVWNLPKRLAKLKKDPWEDFFEIRQSLQG